MIMSFNEDLLTAIFIWLPPKSLVKFKLVCKTWFSLISSDHFSHQHTLHHHHFKTKPSFLLCLSEEKTDHFYLNLSQKNLVPYHFSPSLIEPTISSFSNGLCLLQCPKIKNPLQECYVYNPTTKQSRKIALNFNERYKTILGLNLAFDPSKSPHYTIICVRTASKRFSSFFRPLRFCQIEVYESENRAWTVRGDSFWAPMDVHFNHGVYLNGCVHWRGIFFHIRDGLVYQHPKIVVPNDTSTEKFYESYNESCGYIYCTAHFPIRNSIMVFELEKDCSEWSLKFRIDLGMVSELVSMLGVVRGASEEDSMLMVHEPGKVVGYEFKEESMKELVDFRNEGFYKEGCIQFVSNCAFQFAETLARV